jgi:hypothetical protein
MYTVKFFGFWEHGFVDLLISVDIMVIFSNYDANLLCIFEKIETLPSH